jgi:23S rRNA (guanine745-N1)-methyltransferase
MIDLVVDDLICPHCGGELRVNGASLICSRGHTANVARQGYVSLLGRDSGTHTADSPEMVAARQRIHEANLFEPAMSALGSAIENPSLSEVPGLILDLGSGPGTYLQRALDLMPERRGLAIDNSKFAARRAARCHPRAAAVVADVWDGLPVSTAAAAVVINVFAPRNGEEIARVLAPGGRLIILTPEPDHLSEIVGPLGMISVDPDKEERLERSIAAVPGSSTESQVRWQMELSRQQVADLVAMGPSAGRMAPDEASQALDSLSYPLGVTGAVRVTVVSREH